MRRVAVVCLSLLVARTFGEETVDLEDLEEDEFGEEQLSDGDLTRMFHKIDRNQDGKISMDEIIAHSREMRLVIAKKDVKSVLEDMDTNGDGNLDAEEVLKDMERWSSDVSEGEETAAKRKARENEKFDIADANGDGFLDLDEIPTLFHPSGKVLRVATEAALAERDTNGDLVLSPEEFWGIDASDKETEVSEEEKNDFAKLDKDKNGVVDVEELMEWESGEYHTVEAMRKLFEIADVDLDGHVTLEEMIQAKGEIARTDAQYHFLEWLEHTEL